MLLTAVSGHGPKMTRWDISHLRISVAACQDKEIPMGTLIRIRLNLTRTKAIAMDAKNALAATPLMTRRSGTLMR